jgi:hypothetical protein
MLSEQKMKNSNLGVVSILLSFSNAQLPLPKAVVGVNFSGNGLFPSR